MQEYDYRQYLLMLESTKAPISDMRLLNEMIDRLQTLVSSLKEKDGDWLAKINTQWWILEEIYAYYSSETIQNIDEATIKDIDIARREITKLIEIKTKEFYNQGE